MMDPGSFLTVLLLPASALAAGLWVLLLTRWSDRRHLAQDAEAGGSQTGAAE